MKKLGLFFVVILLSVTVFAQKNVDTIFKKFGEASNAETVKIGSLGWSLLKSFSGMKKDLPLLRKVKSLQVIDMQGCNAQDKQKLISWVKTADKDGYETLMRVKENTDEVYILSLQGKNKIRELIIIDTKDPVAVRFKGNFNLSEIDSSIINFTK